MALPPVKRTEEDVAEICHRQCLVLVEHFHEGIAGFLEMSHSLLAPKRLPCSIQRNQTSYLHQTPNRLPPPAHKTTTRFFHPESTNKAQTAPLPPTPRLAFPTFLFTQPHSPRLSAFFPPRHVANTSLFATASFPKWHNPMVSFCHAANNLHVKKDRTRFFPNFAKEEPTIKKTS